MNIRSSATSLAARKMADRAAKREADSVGTDEALQKVKSAKYDNENGEGEVGKDSASDKILCGFKTSNILRDSAREKNIFIHGKVRLLANFDASLLF